MEANFGIIAAAQVNDDGTQPTSSTQVSYTNIVSSRISAGRYLLTIPVALAEAALQVLVTTGIAGGRNHPVVSRISATTFEVSTSVAGAASEDPPVATDGAFNVVVVNNAGVDYDDAFDIAGGGNVASNGTQAAGSPGPGWVPGAMTTSFPLTQTAAGAVQAFGAIAIYTQVGDTPNRFALRSSVGSVTLLRCFPYNAASPATTVTATAFSFVVIRSRKRS